mgnify:CR=1 FL=1
MKQELHEADKLEKFIEEERERSQWMAYNIHQKQLEIEERRLKAQK